LTRGKVVKAVVKVASVTNANSGAWKAQWMDSMKTRILSYRTKGVREACELYTYWWELARSLRSSSRALAAGGEPAARCALRVP
jgi:hypothetical protein